MKNYRIGSDRTIAWSITRNGEPYNLAGKDITLKVSSTTHSFLVKNFEIDGNKIIWTFLGKDQKHLGPYTLTIIENAGKAGMLSFDRCNAFGLVACSCQENGAGHEDLDISEIELADDVVAFILGNLPLHLGHGEDSIVQDGHNNIATNKGTAVFGSENKVGLKGYYYKYIKFDTSGEATMATIFLSETNDGLSDTEPQIDEAFVNPYEVGDIVSIRNNSIWYNCGVITSIDHDNIRVGNLPFSEVVESTTGREIFVAAKPEKGVKEIGQYAFATGQKNQGFGKASHVEGLSNTLLGNYSHAEGEKNMLDAYASHVEGEENKVYGNYAHVEGGNNTVHVKARYSHTEGQNNEVSGHLSHVEGTLNKVDEASYAAHVEGKGNQVKDSDYTHVEGQVHSVSGYNQHVEGYNNEVGENEHSHTEGVANVNRASRSHVEGSSNEAGSDAYACHVEGFGNEAAGKYAHAEGEYTIAGGRSSHTEGCQTRTNNPNEHAQGVYNVSHDGTIHSVGVGTGHDDRKNAHEIMNDGRHFILGIGGYDGASLKGAVDLATYINSLVKKIETLENIIKEITISE